MATINCKPVDRAGYVLVECLVALLLLTQALVLLQMVAVSTASALDRSMQREAAVASTSTIRNTWLREACHTNTQGSIHPLSPLPALAGARVSHNSLSTRTGNETRLSTNLTWTEGYQGWLQGTATPRVWHYNAESAIWCGI